MKRLGGIIKFKIDGELYPAKGSFEYSLGTEKREEIIGADGVHGFKTTPQVAYISGSITDFKELDIQKFFEIEDATVILELANGKTIVLREATYAGDAKASSEEGEIEVRFIGTSAEEIH